MKPVPRANLLARLLLLVSLVVFTFALAAHAKGSKSSPGSWSVPTIDSSFVCHSTRTPDGCTDSSDPADRCVNGPGTNYQFATENATAEGFPVVWHCLGGDPHDGGGLPWSYSGSVAKTHTENP